MLKVKKKYIRMGITIFHLGRYIVGYTFENYVLKFPTVYPTIDPPYENFEYSYPLNQFSDGFGPQVLPSEFSYAPPPMFLCYSKLL